MGGEYASITLESGYLGTVFVTGGFESYSYAQAGGTIDQNASCDITVNESFSWTNGTLNGTSNICNLNLTGGTGIIAPINQGTVQTGDNINVTSTTLTINPGTIQFLNADNVTGNQGATININGQNAQGQPAPVEFMGTPTITPTSFTMNKGSVATVKGPWNDLTPQQALIINGGKLTILSKGIANVASGTFTQTSFPVTQGSIVLYGGMTTIYSGGTLIATNASILGGKLMIYSDDSGVKNKSANITGSLTLGSNTLVTFQGAQSTSTPQAPEYAMTLAISDNLVVTGTGTTTIQPRVNVAKQDVADTITVGGSLTIQQGATLLIDPFILDSNKGQKGLTWTIFSTKDGITNAGTIKSLALSWQFDSTQKKLQLYS